MRQEISLLLSLILGSVSAGAITLLGDGRSQYAFSLVIVGFPFFILFGGLIVLGARYMLIKYKVHTPYGYLSFGSLLAIILGYLVASNGGGFISGVSTAVGIFVSFMSFSLLLASSKGGNNA
jgi:hypothetical protein